MRGKRKEEKVEINQKNVMRMRNEAMMSRKERISKERKKKMRM